MAECCGAIVCCEWRFLCVHQEQFCIAAQTPWLSCRLLEPVGLALTVFYNHRNSVVNAFGLLGSGDGSSYLGNW
jgi:hypothetical protein